MQKKIKHFTCALHYLIGANSMHILYIKGKIKKRDNNTKKQQQLLHQHSRTCTSNFFSSLSCIIFTVNLQLTPFLHFKN